MSNTAARVAVTSPHKAGAPDASRPLDTGAVTKRLQQELMGLMASSGDGVSAFPAGDSLFDWVGTINVSELEYMWGWCAVGLSSGLLLSLCLLGVVGWLLHRHQGPQHLR